MSGLGGLTGARRWPSRTESPELVQAWSQLALARQNRTRVVQADEQIAVVLAEMAQLTGVLQARLAGAQTPVRGGGRGDH